MFKKERHVILNKVMLFSRLATNRKVYYTFLDSHGTYNLESPLLNTESSFSVTDEQLPIALDLKTFT
jgi:hypothetical protein